MDKKSFIPLLFTAGLLSTMGAYSDHHEETETTLTAEGSDVLRAEYTMCNLNDGKTLKDVERYAKKYGDFAAENGLKYNQSVTIPVHAGDGAKHTHTIVGHWPNGLEMYKEWGMYLNVFKEKYPNLKAPHTCDQSYATFQLKAVDATDSSIESDTTAPLQYATCTLKPDKTMAEAVAAEKQAAKLIAKAGMKGYGTRFIMPYLGQRDPTWDFILLNYWQSYAMRGDMAQNYYKIGQQTEAIVDKVYSCVNPRSYAGKNLFTNWDISASQ